MAEPSSIETPGALTYGWRWALGLAWFGVIAGFSVVSRSSRELGLPTWWLGPTSDPQPYPIIALPFLVPAAVVALTFTRFRWTPWAAIGAGGVLLLVAIGDAFGDYPRIGVVEIALAVAGTAVGAVSLTGRVRPEPAQARPGSQPRFGDMGSSETDGPELTVREGDEQEPTVWEGDSTGGR